MYVYGVEFSGNDIRCTSKPSPELCQEFCQTFSNCVGWEWGYSGDQCCAKTELSNRVENKPGRVAGERNCPGKNYWVLVDIFRPEAPLDGVGVPFPLLGQTQ